MRSGTNLILAHDWTAQTDVTTQNGGRKTPKPKKEKVGLQTFVWVG
jgi:hypothetical protein